ncbi:MAG TPA: substrate-binding domain-containing protein, partial [Candidatus Limnocylindrales bacterium]
MTDREIFEQRLEAAVRGYVEAAPTEINAARLTDALATSVPRVRRLVSRPAWRLPSLGVAWILVVAALLAVAGMGLIASGALRDLHLLPAPPAPSQAPATPPAVIASPAAATPAPSGLASPSPSVAPTASPGPSVPIGIVLPSSFAGPRVTELQDALNAADQRAQILFSQDPAAEKADVEALIGRGIMVLILAPQDGAAAASAADEARAAGSRVIAYDRLILGTAAVDYYVTFDSLAVGAAQAQYLIEKAGATKGNNLYLYAGNAVDDNSFGFFEGAWKKLQPRIADGTFVIRNSSEAVALEGTATLTRDQQGRIVGQVTTNWDFGQARSLAERNLADVPAADKRTVFILAPNDSTAQAIAEAVAADPAVMKAYVTGQDADKASIQAIIDGKQGMTVFKDPRALAKDTVAAAGAFLQGRTPAATTSYNNGAIDVPFKTSAIVTVTRDNVQAALIDSGYFLVSDFSG